MPDDGGVETRAAALPVCPGRSDGTPMQPLRKSILFLRPMAAFTPWQYQTTLGCPASPIRGGVPSERPLVSWHSKRSRRRRGSAAHWSAQR
jgi:hypothetical protein